MSSSTLYSSNNLERTISRCSSPMPEGVGCNAGLALRAATLYLTPDAIIAERTTENSLASIVVDLHAKTAIFSLQINEGLVQ